MKKQSNNSVVRLSTNRNVSACGFSKPAALLAAGQPSKALNINEGSHIHQCFTVAPLQAPLPATGGSLLAAAVPAAVAPHDLPYLGAPQPAAGSHEGPAFLEVLC